MLEFGLLGAAVGDVAGDQQDRLDGTVGVERADGVDQRAIRQVSERFQALAASMGYRFDANTQVDAGITYGFDRNQVGGRIGVT